MDDKMKYRILVNVRLYPLSEDGAPQYGGISFEEHKDIELSSLSAAANILVRLSLAAHDIAAQVR